MNNLNLNSDSKGSSPPSTDFIYIKVHRIVVAGHSHTHIYTLLTNWKCQSVYNKSLGWGRKPENQDETLDARGNKANSAYIQMHLKKYKYRGHVNFFSNFI